jgi:two-component system, chemotaxis family, sensor kinase CheA
MAPNNSGLDDDFMETMLADFLDESQVYLGNLNDKLSTLDELLNSCAADEPLNVDTGILNEMFRDAHSLKGLSAMLQLGNINGLTHKVENLFDAARDQKITIDSDVVELLFQAVDCLTGMVDQLKSEGNDNLVYQPIVDEIQRILDGNGIKNATVSAEELAATFPSTDAAADETSNVNEPELVPVVSLEVPTFDPFAGVVDEVEIPQKYRSIFVADSNESLDTLCEMLLGDPDSTKVDSLLVFCHQIKGSAATIGLNRPAKLAHLMEDVLQSLRESGQTTTKSINEALLFAVDSLRAYIGVLASEGDQPDNFNDAYQRLLAVQVDSTISVESDEIPAPSLVVDVPPADAAASTDQLTAAEREMIRRCAPEKTNAVGGKVVFRVGLPLVEIKVLLVLQRLQNIGRLFYQTPEKDMVAFLDNPIQLVFGLTTDLPLEAVRKSVDLDGVTDIIVETVERAAPARREPTGTSVPVGKSTNATPTTPTIATAALAATAEVEKASIEIKNPVDTGSASRSAVGVATARADTEKVESDASKGKPPETLRVDIDRLDHLMNLAGQLVINKARFGQVRDKLKVLSGNKQPLVRLNGVTDRLQKLLQDVEDTSKLSGMTDTLQFVQSHILEVLCDLEAARTELSHLGQARAIGNDLSEAVHQLERISDGIQKSVMDTRMVPVGPLFGRFKRVIRDITRLNGKDIQLVVHGEKTELDKRMIDELADPLIHMVRNSADHGIESPENREQCGKPRQGIVTLDAFHRGNRVLIRVKDDGKGLDPDKLKAKAVSKGIISQQDAEKLLPQEAFQLIWEPGFSTAETITEISGRGMGMDIVRSKIESLNGTIELQSELGVGTTITIKLPLTMAILPSLLILISNEVYAIPVESVVEIVRFQKKDMPTVHGRLTARVRDRVVSVVCLDDLFRRRRQAIPSEEGTGEKTLVIIGSDGDEMGLVVDHLLGEEDIVVKSLAENYRNVYGLAGASILGDGRVSLILDGAALMDLAMRRKLAAA